MNMIDNILKWVAAKRGLTIGSGQPGYSQWDDPIRSYMITEKYRLALVDELTEVAHQFAMKNWPEKNLSRVLTKDIVEDFFDVYGKRPFTDNLGGSSFNNCLWLFLSARVFAPKLIVESGVWKGISSFILHQGAKEAEVHCFDITFKHLQYRNDHFQYRETDWENVVFDGVDSERSMCFFDCHVNHAKRIKEARNKGFKYLIFDDNPPAHKLYGYGVPAFPSVEMIVHGKFQDQEEIKWVYNGIQRSFKIDLEELEEAKALVKRYAVFPDLSSITRYNSRSGSHSFLSFVEI